jgi:alginate O-acetyltransferase complex protein AlgI
VTLPDILVFSAGGVVYALIVPKRLRRWALLIASLYAIYALQPTLDVRFLDFGLPTAALALGVFGWILTRADGQPFTRADAAALVIAIGMVLLLTLPRYLALPITPTSRPPDAGVVLIGLALAGLIGALLALLASKRRGAALALGVIGMAALFIVIKTEPLAVGLASLLRANVGQNPALASPLDIGWLGFSYLAFRLIHTLRDRQSGLLPALDLRTYLTYLIFFPAYTSGPIDRAERHAVDDARLPDLPLLEAERWVRAGSRIVVGLLKKFVIADTLAVFSLSADLARQADSTGALWLMLYAYAFRLYFDFSGYTDIAIGIGMLYGVQLPENFNNPYAKNHITAFWQSWHMTLSAWARAYIYAPISKALVRRRAAPLAVSAAANGATMLLIGLWHGVSAPFAIWGIWHGVGLTAHYLWSERTRKWQRRLKTMPRLTLLWRWCGTALTFHFVLLGWVWFAIPDFETAAQAFAALFGLR